MVCPSNFFLYETQGEGGGGGESKQILREYGFKKTSKITDDPLVPPLLVFPLWQIDFIGLKQVSVHPFDIHCFCIFGKKTQSSHSRFGHGRESGAELCEQVALSSHFPLPKTLHSSKQFAFFAKFANGVTGVGSSKRNDRISGCTVLLLIEKMNQINTKNYWK